MLSPRSLGEFKGKITRLALAVHERNSKILRALNNNLLLVDFRTLTYNKVLGKS